MNFKRLILFIFVVAVAGLLGWWMTNRPAAVLEQESAEASVPALTPPPAIDYGLVFTQTEAEPITFSTGTLNVAISKRTTHTRADAAYLLENAKECGPDGRPAKYYPELTSTLRQLPKTVYTITDDVSAAKYDVSVIPNLLGYTYLDAAQADFFVCEGDAGQLKAVQLNKQWIVFSQSCAVENRECHNIADIVTPTIRLK